MWLSWASPDKHFHKISLFLQIFKEMLWPTQFVCNCLLGGLVKDSNGKSEKKNPFFFKLIVKFVVTFLAFKKLIIEFIKKNFAETW